MPGLLPAGILALGLGAQVAAAPPLVSGLRREEPGWWIEDIALRGACGGGREAVSGIAVYLPSSYGTPPPHGWPVVIALHGWGHAPRDWRRMGLVELAEVHGFVVALPEMGRTVYESSFYPQSTSAWNSSPGACWVGEVVLPWLRSHLTVSQDRGRTAIIGYSTGGRGALVVAGRYPEFGFAASMSGTYDLRGLERGSGEYRIHEAVLGPRSRFSRRWDDENVVGLRALRVAPHHDFVAGARWA